VSEVIRTGKLLKLNEFAGHKKKDKKTVGQKTRTVVYWVQLRGGDPETKQPTKPHTMTTNATTTCAINEWDKLDKLNNLLSSGDVAYSAVVPYAYQEGDFTPTLKIDLWRGHDLHDLPEAIASLNVVSEGFWEGGRCYCLQA
jgi:hypothetical protein